MDIETFASRVGERFDRSDILPKVDVNFLESHGILGFEDDGDIAIAYEDDVIFIEEQLNEETDTGEAFVYRDGVEPIGRIIYTVDKGARIFIGDDSIGTHFDNRNTATFELTQKLLNITI